MLSQNKFCIYLFNWQVNRENSESDSGECDSNLSFKWQRLDDCKSILKTIQNENSNKLIFAYLNINWIRSKFELLINEIEGTVDVWMISETKIDSFPAANFLVDGFSQPYKADRNFSGGRFILYVVEDIPSNLIKTESLPIARLNLNCENKNVPLIVQSILIKMR